MHGSVTETRPGPTRHVKSMRPPPPARQRGVLAAIKAKMDSRLTTRQRWRQRSAPRIIRAMYETETLSAAFNFLPHEDVAAATSTYPFLKNWAHRVYPPPIQLMRELFDKGGLKELWRCLAPAELASAAIAFPWGRNIARSIHNEPRRREAVALRRVFECINMCQVTNIEPARDLDDITTYDAIQVPDLGIRVGTWALIVYDGTDPDEDDILIGQHGQVVRCVEVGGVIIVYMLLEMFFGEGPLVVVQGTTQSIQPYVRAMSWSPVIHLPL